MTGVFLVRARQRIGSRRLSLQHQHHRWDVNSYSIGRRNDNKTIRSTSITRQKQRGYRTLALGRHHLDLFAAGGDCRRQDALSNDSFGRINNHVSSCRSCNNRRFLKTSSSQGPQGLSVAIVGAGPAGLSAALHLAPLVSSGIIRGPIHLYESADGQGSPSTSSSEKEGHYVTRGTGSVGRDVGVGIWSTALTPFLSNNDNEEDGDGEDADAYNKPKQPTRQSHQKLLQSIDEAGTYVDKVGYRTPDGVWLAKSNLSKSPIIVPSDDDSQQVVDGSNNNDIDNDDDDGPGLIFLPETKLLDALHAAVDHEMNVEHTVEQFKRTVQLIMCDDLPTASSNGRRRGGGGRLVFDDGSQSDEKYSLILSAGGTHSILRKRYSRHMDHTYRLKFGISLNPNQPDGGKLGGCKRVAPVALTKKNTNHFLSELSSLPLTEDMEERGYVVFRGNSPLPIKDHGDIAFQTWGTKHNLRFATVPCIMNNNNISEEDGENENSDGSKEGQVWFFTTNDDTLISSMINQEDDDNTNNGEWKRKLVEYVKEQNWHDPVAQLIESTPSSQMWMESALAHQYSAAPLGSGFEQQYDRDEETGEVMFLHVQSEEPLLCYVGDADMTVDPVLAQGITIAMEDGADIARCLEQASQQVDAKLRAAAQGEGGVNLLEEIKNIPQLQYDTLRKSLKARHEQKMGRLLCLLRATELVQTLAQPSNWTGFLSASIIRPLMKYGAPDMVKKTVFDWMLKYSLGWYQKKG
jgi:2-polyprenyl-6-methoxyphenol hydroxylase-like FAD-dependent oxidoreductase